MQQRAAAEITDQVNEVGARIREVATRRRGRLSRDLAQLEAAAGAAPSADTLVPRAARDAARRGVQHAESLFAMARGRGSDVRQRDALSAPHVDQRLPPLAVLVAALVLALCGRFGWSLASEVRRPTIGSAREAERAAGAPVLAIARAAAASRTRGGIDPFRMLYLALTATGTKMRTVTIGGHERGVIATVAARLASAAAGDARATMVVDADAEGSSLGGYYHLGPEPGFTDAVAGVHLWRDVTHSVGASEGLTIDVVTGGAIRRDEPDRETLNSARSEFARVRSEYDLCVMVAPTAVALQRVAALVDSPVTVLCAQFGSTTIAWMLNEAAEAHASGALLHGLVLWDGPTPRLITRSEQAASVYRRDSMRPATP